MQRCKHLKLLEKQAGGRELYVCSIKNIRLGSPSAEMCIDCEDYEPDFETQPEKFIYLDYLDRKDGGKKDYAGVFHCHWKLLVSDDVLEKKDVETIKRWTDGKVKTSGEITLSKTGKRVYNLEIAGRGYDNRCRWCESFRTALKTRTGNLVERRGTCMFEFEK